MKFNLKEQIITPEVIKIVARQYADEDLDPEPMNRKQLKELKSVMQDIELEGLPSHFVVKKLQGKIGHGVFLHPRAKPIARGQVIAPYAGIVTLVPQNAMDDADYAFDPVTDLKLTKEEQKRFDPKNKYHQGRLYSLKLDAYKKGNFTRFINHSVKPNVIAYLSSTKKNPYQIIYFAKRAIQPGEQLLVCYEDDAKTYWSALGIKPFPMTARTFRLNSSLEIIEKNSVK